jgi:hypothetical protein
MAAPLNTCTTIEQRGVVRFVGKKYGSKGYPQRNKGYMALLLATCVTSYKCYFLQHLSILRHVVFITTRITFCNTSYFLQHVLLCNTLLIETCVNFGTRVTFCNTFHFLQHVLLFVTHVTSCNTCYFLQHVLQFATRVTSCNMCYFLQQVLLLTSVTSCNTC